MASIEEVHVSEQIKLVLHRWPNIMRDNAQAYKANAQGLQVDALAAIMNDDADHYMVFINKLEAVATRNLTTFTNALAVLGNTVNQANTLKNTLKSAALAQKAADKSTKAMIDSASDALLAAVPAFERLF